MKTKIILPIIATIVLDALLISLKKWDMFLLFVLVQSMITGGYYYLYVNNHNLSISKIKSINFLLTLIGSICFIAMIFPLPTVISLILSNAFGMCFGLLIINYNYEKELKSEIQ